MSSNSTGTHPAKDSNLQDERSADRRARGVIRHDCLQTHRPQTILPDDFLEESERQLVAHVAISVLIDELTKRLIKIVHGQTEQVTTSVSSE